MSALLEKRGLVEQEGRAISPTQPSASRAAVVTKGGEILPQRLIWEGNWGARLTGEMDKAAPLDMNQGVKQGAGHFLGGQVGELRHTWVPVLARAV